MIKIVFKYIISYILPLYVILFVGFIGFNIDLLKELGINSDFFIWFL